MKKVLKVMLIFISLFIFLDFVKAEEYNNIPSEASTISCGSGMMEQIPSLFPKVVSTAYTIIQIVVPIVLVVIGLIDLLKSVSSQKEDDIKKGQQILIKRIIAAVVVFLIFTIVKFVIGLASDGNSGIIDCTECFINNKCND